MDPPKPTTPNPNPTMTTTTQVWSPLLSGDPKRSTPSELLDGLRGLGRPSTLGGVQQQPALPKWAVLMLRSGRFAGAVFEVGGVCLFWGGGGGILYVRVGAWHTRTYTLPYHTQHPPHTYHIHKQQGPRVLAHKAFRRYTQRAKQGGSQSSYDKKGTVCVYVYVSWVRGYANVHIPPLSTAAHHAISTNQPATPKPREKSAIGRRAAAAARGAADQGGRQGHFGGVGRAAGGLRPGLRVGAQGDAVSFVYMCVYMEGREGGG